VVACEPDPHNASLLTRTIAENGFEHVRIVEAAISRGVGRATLHRDPLWHGVHSLARDNCVNPGATALDVPTLSVDSLLEEGKAPFDFVKIDAQGAEAHILAGATRLLAQTHAIVVMEVWPQGLQALGGTLAAVTVPFRANGFSSFTMGPNRTLEPIDQSEIERQADGLGRWSSFNLAWIK
jgi:FkbM family methyltransferase